MQHDEAQFDTMRRGEPHFGNDEDRSSPKRQFRTAFHQPHSGYSISSTQREQSRSSSHSSEISQTTNPSQPPSFGSTFTNTHSPTYTPHPPRPGILYPPSIKFSTPTPTLPPISSSPLPPSTPTTTTTTPPTHQIQDLQTKLHLQTTTLQTLQSEHTNLLQSLAHHRKQISTLEQNLQLSTTEVSILCEEKERLQAQILVLETQVHELQHTRDETRKQLSENGNQYMRIVEMASRLQERGVQERKEWGEEKGKLLARIGVLEEAMITSTRTDGGNVVVGGGSSSSGISTDTTTTTTTTISLPWGASREGALVLDSTAMNTELASMEMVNVLRGEIARLRKRNRVLEEAMRTMVEENKGVGEAAGKVVERSLVIERVGSCISEE